MYTKRILKSRNVHKKNTKYLISLLLNPSMYMVHTNESQGIAGKKYIIMNSWFSGLLNPSVYI